MRRGRGRLFAPKVPNPSAQGIALGLRPTARSIMPHAGTSAAFLIGRAVGAEYRFESISWGDAPGWDEGGALPLKSHTRAMPQAGMLRRSRPSRRDGIRAAIRHPAMNRRATFIHRHALG